MKRGNILTLLVFAALLVAGGFAYWDGFRGEDDKSPTGTTPPPPSREINPPPGNGIGNRSREELPPFPKDYDKIRYDARATAELGEEARRRQEDAFKDALARIEKRPDDPDVWIQLGGIKKMFGDYQGAIAAWNYVAMVRPKDATGYNNLGDLYWHYLRDFVKAEASYKKAIENFPENLGLYKDLSDLYRFDYKEKAHLADDTLLKALKVSPKSITALAWLGGYYRDTGDKQKAREYFQRALDLDPGNTPIQTELKELGK